MSEKTAKCKEIVLLFKTSEDISLEKIEKRVHRARRIHPESRISIRVTR